MYLRAICLSCLLVLFCSNVTNGDDSEVESFPLQMPFVRPKLPQGESYLCTSVGVDFEETLFVRGFAPRAAMETAHHIIVLGCDRPREDNADNLWNCGGTLGEQKLSFDGGCPAGSKQQMMFMWSRNGTGITFPEGAGIPIGKDSQIASLVLQVHYVSTERIPRSGDSSGVDVLFTRSPLPLHVGLLSLHVHGVIAPRSRAVWDVACRMNATLVPFAFLTHTHQWGRWVSGWAVSEDSTRWTRIGARNPQDPQSFYPADEDVVVSASDTLAARCVMQSDVDHTVLQGLSAHSEMCDYFVYYLVKEGRLIENADCTAKADFSWDSYGFKNIPIESLGV